MLLLAHVPVPENAVRYFAVNVFDPGVSPVSMNDADIVGWVVPIHPSDFVASAAIVDAPETATPM